MSATVFYDFIKMLTA